MSNEHLDNADKYLNSPEVERLLEEVKSLAGLSQVVDEVFDGTLEELAAYIASDPALQDAIARGDVKVERNA